MYSVKILADSLAPCNKRLTTWELTYPRFIHAELMTHRMFSRNSASSRAIPSRKLIGRVLDDPAMPVHWGLNQPGMQAREELEALKQELAEKVWLQARDTAVEYARSLESLGVHKQIVNRIIEPWMFITVIVSATEWDNFFHLRCHEDAQPEIKWVADEMHKQYQNSSPTPLLYGEWHLPLIFDDDRLVEGADLDTLKKVSVGRCARVSYLTHDGKRDLAADVALHDRLAKSGHWSPFEHVAMALSYPDWHGNLRGWYQYRKMFGDESGPVLNG